NGRPDYEVQLAHYFGVRNSVALMYYNGNMLMNPSDFALDSAPAQLLGHYSRLYLVGNWSPNEKWDFVAGTMSGNDDININPLTGNLTNTVGPTSSSGSFLEADYYFNKTVFSQLRYDTFTDSSNSNAGLFAAAGAGVPVGDLSSTTTAWTGTLGAQINKFFLVTAEYTAATGVGQTPFPNPGLFVPQHTNTFTFEIKHIQ
ncbi:MAG: hypothetical protein ACYCW6_17685, partial [Candidatus Xenobia bacterium]